jgi:hypothetical protein
MQAAFAVQPTWAKKATAFPEQCYPGKTQACQPVRIPAPDGKSSVEVRYREKFVGDWILQAYLRVTTPGRGTHDAALPEGFQNIDLLWCQVMAYELEVPTGRILKRIDAKHLKLSWQKSMGWNFRIPDPPLYCE